MKRAVGYCTNTDCEDYSKGTFLLNHGDKFFCSRCRVLGFIKKEEGDYTQVGEIFTEVRVEYNYSPVDDKYTEIAIVRDESLPEGNVYTLQSPLVKTQNRALKIAEAILSNLNRCGVGEGGVPNTRETILCIDDPREKFAAACAALARDLEGSNLARHREASAPKEA